MESDSSMNQILNYGENHFRLKIWSQISCLISSLKTFISSNAEIEGKHCPPAFQRFSNILQDYKTVFEVRKFPFISQATNIDKDLRVKLQINGILVPLLE